MDDEGIYSSVSFTEEDLAFQKRKEILNLLKSQKGHMFTAREISLKLGFPTNNTCIDVRKAITLLLELDSEPICSHAKGFFYPLSSNQLKFYYDSLNIRKKGLERRIKKIEELYLDWQIQGKDL